MAAARPAGAVVCVVVAEAAAVCVVAAGAAAVCALAACVAVAYPVEVRLAAEAEAGAGGSWDLDG